MPIGTKKAPSARTVGDFRQLLVFLHISLSRHPVGPQCPNWSEFPSVTGVSASLTSTCALHIGAGSVVLSAQMALLCAWGG